MRSWKIGLVGLPNVGKSSLFKLLTKKEILIANYPFSTIDPNIADVEIYDQRLPFLVNFFQSLKVIPSTIKVVDIAGIVKGASQKVGLGGEFLSHIRAVDLICHVVRCFKDDGILHVESEVDPIRDLATIQLELILADIEQADKRIEKINKLLKKKSEKLLEEELDIMKRVLIELKKEVPIIDAQVLTAKEKELLKAHNFLTLKPFMVIANCDEDNSAMLQKMREHHQGLDIFPLLIAMENDYGNFSVAEQQEIGWKSFDKTLFFGKIKEALHLKTFFTAGKSETRSWLTEIDANAVSCAGLIHSDIQNRFVRAEIYNVNQLVSTNQEPREIPKETASYLVKDGDVCNFLFSR